ncbi:MAG: UDP-N-acetylmuramate dehydrogenase [Synergistaceae bacterium]|nr:UDP-N-acetylmuramate dehydrogenase [Synergistaceae bacterium]
MLKNYPLRELNTWNVGGCCSFFASPRSIKDAHDILLSALRGGERLYILGGGSNILVNDGHLQAVVLYTGYLNGIYIKEVTSDGIVQIEVESGFSVRKLQELAIKNGWGGLEFLTGIPGSVGGALWGNAGAQGEGFSPLVKILDTVDYDGNISILTEKDLNWNYRECPCDREKTLFITKCTLKLSKASQNVIFERMKYFAEMKKGQPLGKKTAGCVFKNPPGDSAGRLLDGAGCKGISIGGAVVSEIHANFIVNKGDATARDIFTLSERCRERVYSQYGVGLDYEIHFFGDFEKS